MASKLVVYLSGPMTGNPDYVAFFTKYEKELQAKGYAVFNPAKLDGHNPPPWHECLIRDLGYVLLCDYVALLPGWEDSRGSLIEALFALKLGKGFICVPDSATGVTYKLNFEEAEDLPWGDDDDLPDDGLDDIPGWTDFSR